MTVSFVTGLVMTLVGLFVFWAITGGPGRRPIRVDYSAGTPVGPYRDAARTEVVAESVGLTDDLDSRGLLRELGAVLVERDRYRHALEAIATLDQDGSSQRIADKALKH